MRRQDKKRVRKTRRRRQRSNQSRSRYQRRSLRRIRGGGQVPDDIPKVSGKETVVVMALRGDDMEIPVVVSRKEANRLLDTDSYTP